MPQNAYVYDGTAWRQAQPGGLTVSTPTGNKTANAGWVYDGTTWRQFWPSAVPVVLNGSSTIWDTVNLSWNQTAPGATFIVKRGGTVIYNNGTGLSVSDPGRVPSTAYVYTIEAYLGGVLTSTATKTVTTPAHAFSASAAALNWSTIRVSWTDNNQGSISHYHLWKDNADAGYVTGDNRYWDSTGLAASSTHHYHVTGHRTPGEDIPPQIWTGNVSTPARPTVQKTYESVRAQYASYHENGSNRGSAELYYGWYSTNWGVQKSQARWDFPADMRNCISIDSIQLRWWNQHHFLVSGGVVGMSVHHNTNLGGSYGGSTGSLRLGGTGGSVYNWAAPRGSWISGSEWFHHNDTWTDRTTVREEFRVMGAQGFELRTNQGGSQNGYGYASNDVIIKVVYTTWA